MDGTSYPFGSNQSHAFQFSQQSYSQAPIPHQLSSDEYIHHQGYTNNQGSYHNHVALLDSTHIHSQGECSHYETHLPYSATSRCGSQVNGPPSYLPAPDDYSMGPPPQHLQQISTILRADAMGCNEIALQGMVLDNSENSQPPLSANGRPLPSANGPPPPQCQANGPPLYQLAPDNDSMGPPPQHLQKRHTTLRADPLGCNETASQGMALDNSVNGPSTSSTNGPPPPSANGPPPPSAHGPPPPSANGPPWPSANGPPPPIANGPPPPSANGNTVLRADPVEVIPTLPPPPKIPAKSSKGSQDFRLSAQEMSAYEKLSSQTLRNLQSTHIMYRKLTEDVKQAAEDLYLEYHRKILLLSLEYSRPAVAIARYLGQGRMRRTNQWNDYVANSEAAQEEFDRTEIELSERNKSVAAGYHRNKNPTANAAPLPAESDDTPVVFIRKKKLPSQTKMMADVETWKLSVQRQAS
ncbi:hypothetical protein PCASD_15879 [Puccinia coronata f. sp. avenae]|uniref:Uncharacterized protein n=1 Tax=Puccinia coronata f. sp. avenae TaxID=200324 RepID=A0A2N5U7U9_9BASI|nr:hypothetical protein PCASD_15879 [Puccinia coronata f. sp. avenae]